ncbi:MAG: hypothetical protein F6K04_00940 [Leptolyngbya sp. SIO4C5]|nr:hypothetical protein [Leptolyngbya sp. SIO4C5]
MADKENLGFPEVDEETNHNSNNGNGRGSQITTAPAEKNANTNSNGSVSETDDDSIPYEEQLGYAGVDPDEEDELVTTEELIEGPSTAKQRGAENSPLPRLALVAAGLGAIAFIIWIFSGLFGGSEQVAQPGEENPFPDEETSPYSESDRYKAELALIEQEDAQPEERVAIAQTPERPNQPEADGETQSPQTPAQPTATRSSPSRSVPSSPSPSPPPPPPEPAASTLSPSPARQPLPDLSGSSRSPSPTPQLEEEVDPLEQWSRLSRVGSAGAEVALRPEPEFEEEATTSGDRPRPTRSSSGRNPAASSSSQPEAENFPFPSARIGDNPVPLPEQQQPETAASLQPLSSARYSPTAASYSTKAQPQGELVAMSPGTRGILNRRPTSNQPTAQPQQPAIRQVAIGSSAQGTVTVPVVYAGGDGPTGGRSAVELTSPLLDINGQVALPEGTVLITEISNILEANIIQLAVVAIVYQDAAGRVRQEAIEPGVITVRGEDNEPLVAEVENDGGSSFGDDLLVGLAGALGNIGRVINAPDAVTTASSGSSGNRTSTSTSTTVTSGNNDNIFGAALEGFFTPTAERLSERSQNNRETAQPYLIVEEGEEVSIFVDGLLEVAL